MIHNLEYLTFTMYMMMDEGNPQEWEFGSDLASLVRRLEDHGVTKALKELNIVVQAADYANLEDAAVALAKYQEWDMLDAVRWSSALQKVQVYLQYGEIHSTYASELLQSLMQPRLPQLTERGVLSIGFGTLVEFETRGWLRVWS